MHFQKKIIFMYSLLIILLAAVLGFSFYRYTEKKYIEAEYENLETLARKTVQQFEETLKPMQQIADYLLSDMEVLEALKVLSSVSADTALRASYREEATELIQTRLNSYYITKNFHRVVVFNQRGSLIASKDYSTMMIDRQKGIDGIGWLEQAEQSYGSQILIGAHEDYWSVRSPQMVFSTVKKIQGPSYGFIEVQNTADLLEGIFEGENDTLDVVVFLEDGSIFYSSRAVDRFYKDDYAGLLQIDSGGIGEWTNPSTAKAQVYTSAVSENDHFRIYLFKDKQLISGEASYVAPLIFVMVFIIVSVSIVYIVFVSRILTRPIRRLRDQMEHTRIDDLGQDIGFRSTNDEIEALGRSYQQVLNRLNDSVIRAQKMSVLQLKAQYDSLQAQVNPHFLYNVLNVISARGLAVGDEMICDICHNLASMLRFSTNIKTKEASIEEEEAYVRQYFYLLKARYDYKLEYSIDISKTIKAEKLPKIVLQQIVENCIYHGFSEMEETMVIRITGWADDGWWYIRVSDNGKGFLAEDFDKIRERMERTRESIMNRQSNIEMEIGGMGLINAYARLLLVKSFQVKFLIANHESGADVTIGARMEGTEETDVPSDDN